MTHAKRRVKSDVSQQFSLALPRFSHVLEEISNRFSMLMINKNKSCRLIGVDVLFRFSLACISRSTSLSLSLPFFSCRLLHLIHT